MMRRLVTIHKAVKAKEFAKITELVDDLFGGDVRVEQTADGVTLKHTNHWNNSGSPRVDGR